MEKLVTEVTTLQNKKEISIYTPKDLSESYIALSEQFKSKITSEQKQAILKSIKDKLGDDHPFDYIMIDGIIQKFGLVNAVINKISDFVIGPGFTIDSDNEEIIKILDEWRDETEFESFLRPWLKQALSKGAGFIEIAGLSDRNKINTVKTISSNTMYIKRDEFGNITEYNQFLGTANGRISDQDIIHLKPGEIVHLNINVIGDSPYGYGIVYSALQSIDNFLLAQNSMHKLVKRKANVPIHAKLGNVEKDDYPKQSDIDGFGSKLQFMNEVTEWVTGPNVEMKVLDFGNIGDKFEAILENDYKLLSYSFEVPETIMGAGNVPEGLAQVQMDAFNRRVVSIQQEISHVLRAQLFNRILASRGILDFDYEIVWNQVSEEEVNKKIEVYQKVLSTGGVSPGMQKEIEKKLAILLEIEYEDVEQNNEESKDVEREDQDLDMKRQIKIKKKSKEAMEEEMERLAPQEVEIYLEKVKNNGSS